MNHIEAKLANWAASYERLKDARGRMKQALEQPGPVPPALRQEVKDWDRKCGVALDELNAEYAKAKGAAPGTVV